MQICNIRSDQITLHGITLYRRVAMRKYSDKTGELERREQNGKSRAIKAETESLPLNKGKPIPSYFPFLPLQRTNIRTIIQH